MPSEMQKKEINSHIMETQEEMPSFEERLDKLINDKTRLEAILTLSDIIFLILDKNGNVSLLNEKGFEVLGVEDVMGKNYENLLRGNIKDDSILIFKNFLDPASEENTKMRNKMWRCLRRIYFKLAENHIKKREGRDCFYRCYWTECNRKEK